MRERPPIRLHRKQIADSAGVAPGLVTYYFPSEAALIEAAARPVIEGYLERLRNSVNHVDSSEAALRRLVDLLLEIGRDNGALLDTYIHYIKERDVPHKQDILIGSYNLLHSLLKQGEQCGAFRSTNTPFMATAIWGMCKTVSRTPELLEFFQDGSATKDGGAIVAELIVEVLLRALKPDRVSAAEPST